MILAIVLVVLAILVVVGILVVTYKLINRLPQDHGNGKNDEENG